MQINRLEDEKESLILQVSVLTDQVEAQGEKIRDLEFTKEEMQIKLEEAEQFLESVSCFYIRLFPYLILRLADFLNCQLLYV